MLQSFSEPQRLAVLERYALNPLPEAAFDRLTRLAARLFQTPIALISLVGERQIRFKSCFGLDLRQTDRSLGFCTSALESRDVLVIPDTQHDARFVDHPMVVGAPYIRFYAGAPLLTLEGHILGTLCLLDPQPRAAFSAADRAALTDLAALVVDEFELRLARQAAEQEAQAQTLQAQMLGAALEQAQLLGALGDLAALDLSPEDLLPPVVELVSSALQVDWSGLMALQGNHGILRSHWHRTADPAFVTRVGARLRREDGGLMWAAAEQAAALFVDDYQAAHPQHRTDLKGAGGRSVVSVGLGEDGPVRYVMTLARVGRAQPWTARDRQLVQAVTGVVRQSVTQAAARVALRESEARLHLALNAAPVILWATDVNGLFTVSQGRGLTDLGSADSVVGRSLREVFADTPEIVANFERALAGESFTAQVALAGRVYESRYAPLLGEDGTPIGVTGTGYDVTATVQARQEAVRAREQAEALLDLSRVLEADTAPPELTHAALAALGRVLQAGWLTLWVREGEVFLPLAEQGERPPAVREREQHGVPVGQYEACGVLRGQRVFLHRAELPEEAQQDGVWGVALLPVLLEVPGREVVLAVSRGADFEGWLPFEQDLLIGAARILGAAAGRRLRLHQVEEAARTDSLTGLGNRRAFELELATQLGRSQQRHTSVGLLSIDLDGLKQINDTWGHACGDALLREFAQALRRSLRPEDRVHRLGGDEYVVVLPAQEPLKVLLERLAAALEATRALGFPEVDASWGLASFPAETQDPDELLRLSDQRMYADKARKRAGQEARVNSLSVLL